MSEVTFDFSGKCFAVIGASSGMGHEIAVELADAGAEVLAIARNEERLAALAEKEHITTAHADVTTTDMAAWKKLFRAFTTEHGKLDGFVYTAGISGLTPLRMFDKDTAKSIMDTGFWGIIDALRAATLKTVANSGSSYVLFSSVGGLAGEPGMMAYAASKAAVRMAMRSLASDLAKDGHRINAVCPGWVETPMTKKSIDTYGVPEKVIDRHLLGTGKPEDVAGLVLFLLSDRSHWITGEDFVVDGGYLCGAFA